MVFMRQMNVWREKNEIKTKDVVVACYNGLYTDIYGDSSWEMILERD